MYSAGPARRGGGTAAGPSGGGRIGEGCGIARRCPPGTARPTASDRARQHPLPTSPTTPPRAPLPHHPHPHPGDDHGRPCPPHPPVGTLPGPPPIACPRSPPTSCPTPSTRPTASCPPASI